MVFTQTLGKIAASKLKKPKGKNKVHEIMKRNRDIKNEIDASVRAAMPKNNKQRDLARQRAIIKAINRNRTFREVVTVALTRLVTHSG
jgi:hypothetical protein